MYGIVKGSKTNPPLNPEKKLQIPGFILIQVWIAAGLKSRIGKGVFFQPDPAEHLRPAAPVYFNQTVTIWLLFQVGLI